MIINFSLKREIDYGESINSPCRSFCAKVYKKNILGLNQRRVSDGFDFHEAEQKCKFLSICKIREKAKTQINL